MKIKPHGRRVIVELIDDPQSGRIVTIQGMKRQTRGITRAIGSHAEKFPFPVKLGDVLLFDQHAGQDIELDGKAHKIMGYDQVVAVVG